MIFFKNPLNQNFQKFNVSNLAETFHKSAKYKIVLVAKVSARLETFNFLYTYIFLILNKIFEKLNVSNLAETYHTSAKYKIILVAKVSARLETFNFLFFIYIFYIKTFKNLTSPI